MQNQELLLLQILKFPVIAIKFIAKVFSILTYLPNYAILYLIDSVLFNHHLASTLFLYAVTWLPKILLLGVIASLFGGEFYIIFSIMQLYEHGLVIQICGMILTLAGLLILMRKGYLTLLKKYNLTKLKSPMEHIQIGLIYLVDVLGIVLCVINAALVINIHRTWDYQYNPNKNFTFIKHVFNLIRQSLISYIEFFYVKIFFKVFPWRFQREINTYQKQKDEKNVLNCMVLLTLIYLSTLLDIIVIAVFGLPCVIHFQRKKFLKEVSQTHQKYKITLKTSWFILLHTLQFLVVLSCTIFCWSSGVRSLKLWIKFDKTSQLFDEDLASLIIEALLKIPYLLTSFLILLSIYKYQRRLFLSKSRQAFLDLQEKQDDDPNAYIWITFKCFGELIFDLLFILPIILSTLLKPQNIWWIKSILTQDHLMNHDLVIYYFVKNIIELVLLVPTIVLTILVFIYEFKKPLQLYQKAGEQILNDYKLKLSKENHAAPPVFDERIFILTSKSHLKKYFFNLLSSFKSDIPYLPIFFLAKMCFINLYLPEVQPQNTPNLYINIQKQYYKLSVNKSKNSKEYMGMQQRIKASGGLINDKEQYKFWKHAYKSQRQILIQRIMTFLLPKKSVQRIKQKIQKGTQFSEISNHYWYHRQLAYAMVKRFIFLVIEAILTLIGILILFPLTLWRIPTFVKLFLYYKNRKYFFPILLKIYVQMFKDVFTLPVKIIAFLLAPRMYVLFVIKTSFKYGPAGIETFELYQQCKFVYLKRNLIKHSIACLIIHFQVSFILCLWVQIKNMRNMLRRQKLTILSLYKDVIFTKMEVPNIDLMMAEPNAYLNSRLYSMAFPINQVFLQAGQDLPYLFLMLFIFFTMPWRINYIIQTIKDMREDTTERKSFFKLLRNIFKDYACIFLNIILLLSVFKTKKALFLIRRNYRLNFFVGFLQYSYFQELINQMKNLGVIYKNVFFMIIAMMFGWTRAVSLINQLQALRKKEKEEEQSAVSNKKLYQNTVKSGKELQTLHKMGYYNYISVCSFLTVPEIIKLRQVDQFNYMMTQRQEIWFVKWQQFYSKTSNEVAESFQTKCKNAFIRDKNQNRGQIITYQHVIMKHFLINVFEQNVDLALFLRGKIPEKYYDMIFKNYEYAIHEGFGPQNELPQAQHEDEQFLRLTNQVRRPKVYLTELKAWMHLFYFRGTEYLAQKLHRFFRQDSNRRIKQLILIILILSLISSYLSLVWLLRDQIFCISSLIGLKIIFGLYFHSFMWLLLARCSSLANGWVSLIPFDLYFDFIRARDYMIQQIKTKVVIPIKNFAIKFWKILCQLAKKIYIKMKQKGNQLYQKIKLVGEKIKKGAEATARFTTKYSVLFVQKVIKPLYISIADKIRKLKNLLVQLFTVIFKSIKSLAIFIGKLLTSFYEAIRSLFLHVNELYFFILKSTMTFLLKFGLIGNLVFTLFGLIIMTLPTLIWLTLYRERWYMVASTIHTMVLIVAGYKHLNKIRSKAA